MSNISKYNQLSNALISNFKSLELYKDNVAQFLFEFVEGMRIYMGIPLDRIKILGNEKLKKTDLNGLLDQVFLSENTPFIGVKIEILFIFEFPITDGLGNLLKMTKTHSFFYTFLAKKVDNDYLLRIEVDGESKDFLVRLSEDISSLYETMFQNQQDWYISNFQEFLKGSEQPLLLVSLSDYIS